MVFVPVSLWCNHRYTALLTSLMAKDCRYLLDSLLYNPELYPGNDEAFSNNHAYFVRKIMEYFCLSCLRASLFCACWASPQPVWWVLLRTVKVKNLWVLLQKVIFLNKINYVIKMSVGSSATTDEQTCCCAPQSCVCTHRWNDAADLLSITTENIYRIFQTIARTCI